MNHIPFKGASWNCLMHGFLSEDPLGFADCNPAYHRFVSDVDGLITLAINPADTCTRDFLMSNKFQEKLKKNAENIEIRVVADSNIPMPEPPPPPPLPAPKKAEAAEKRTSTPLNRAFRRVIAASADFLRVLAAEESIPLSTINDVHEGTMKYLHRLKNVTANHD